MARTGTPPQASTTRPPDALPAFKSEPARERFVAAYDAALGEWPVPYEAFEVATEFGSTHVVASGPADAPSLLLLPSFAGTAVAWRLNIAALSRDHRVYAIDVIGQPGKGWAHRRLRDRREYARWLAQLLDGLGVHRASMVGCSFGGFLALNQASLTPERVERVVLISPVGTFASQYWKLIYSARIKRPLLNLVRRLRRTPHAPSMADLGMRPRDERWAALMAATMSSFAQVSVINPAVLGRGELRAIRAPALLLIGDGERLYDAATMLQYARRRMPRLQGRVVAGADHIAAMAQPEQVQELILQFLRSDTAAA
ncbi:alpha/beta fold hydrolase [Lysobacter sp. CA199]|uniref:alpha/beta fold hydrolase n=1 Tax=Lysobacter sp. CA199 TaxID=3455608 RepID=UPI003F8D6125